MTEAAKAYIQDKTFRCTQPHPAATGGRECKIKHLGYFSDGTPLAFVQFNKGYTASLPTSVLVSVK
jgi:hypothetical protein